MFLFIFQNQFTTHQKPSGHLLFPVNSLQERLLNICELFYPISEVERNHQVHLHQAKEAHQQPCTGHDRTCQEPERLHLRLLLIYVQNYIL